MLIYVVERVIMLKYFNYQSMLILCGQTTVILIKCMMIYVGERQKMIQLLYHIHVITTIAKRHSDYVKMFRLHAC